MTLLEVKDLTKSFGGLVAVNNVSFEVEKGSIRALIGPNGSGKTTVFNLITSILSPDNGSIFFNGKDITKFKPHQIAQIGIGRTFQLTKPFNRLTVTQNLLVASPFSDEDKSMEKVEELLDFLELMRLREEEAWNLSYGQMKLLELARVLMFDPDILLLDEPTAGVNPVLKEEILAKLRELNQRGKTFLIIEHDMKTIGDFCETAIVLIDGEKCLESAPCDLRNHEVVRKAYFLE
jgi:branched-chain amino acid transport system ATP-binding protein